MSGGELERLRLALARLTDAHGEALDAVDRALESGGGARPPEMHRLEEALEDVRDILVGAWEDVQEIMDDGGNAS